jgi:hypothetical protein
VMHGFQRALSGVEKLGLANRGSNKEAKNSFCLFYLHPFCPDSKVVSMLQQMRPSCFKSSS